jgi:hypothetical protein
MARDPLDAERIQQILERLGREAKGPGAVYVTGGASALLIGWRQSTVDLDLKFSPEPEGIFEAIPQIKIELNANIELASPADFIPEVPGWRSRSRPVGRFGQVDFFHYDFVSQALAKIERGHARDLDDVRAMLRLRLIDCAALRTSFEAIRPALIRFPAIEPDVFVDKVLAFLEDNDGA